MPAGHRLAVVALGVMMLAAVPSAAHAQFAFFGQGEASTEDIYDSIGSHGFRLVGPLMRNGEVYVADVVDRRQRRQRLIISRASGQIVQRFFVDFGGRPPASMPPPPPVARADDSDFFSRLTRGWGDDPPPRPPADVDSDGAVAPPVLPRQQRIARPPRPSDIEPRVATRRDDAPVIAKPLPVPAPAAAPKALPTPAPVTASAPPPPAAPTMPSGSPPPARATVVSTDPLRIPGQRTPEADTGPAKQAAAAKPKPAPKDVPVAPLD